MVDDQPHTIHRSFTLHELLVPGNPGQLLPVADRFPKVWTIPYNLACYCSQLRRFEEAGAWLKPSSSVFLVY